MILAKNFFNKSKIIPVDEFFQNVLFDKTKGYYSSKIPLGLKGDFITSPGISNLFSEIISIWIVSVWETFKKPKKFNLIELGPGDGKFSKVLIETLKKFPEINKSINIFLYEKSKILKKVQKKKLNNKNIKWINNFNSIKKGPTIFVGNEFFDAIPIKQFSKIGKTFYEKCYTLNKNNKIKEIFKKVSPSTIKELKKFKSIKNQKFIEFPKLGFMELKKILRKIHKSGGGILLIDYGYLNQSNKDTLQSVFKHKKNSLLKNLGKADITYLVNFKLLKEYFIKENLVVKKVVSQKFFLEKMGILERANNLSKKMSFKEQSDLYYRLKRLLDPKLMGSLFKVIFAYKFDKHNFFGFK